MGGAAVTSAMGVPIVEVQPLFADVYAGDLNGHARWDKLAACGVPWCGGIIKAGEGVHGGGEWFNANWQAIRAEGRDRYGNDWWRGAYFYGRFTHSAVDQAELFHLVIERAGGWGIGDLWPIIDVESANNTGCTRTQVEDWVETYVAESKRLHGREVILYGGSLLYDLGITSRMGCKALWIARYAPTLPAKTYERIGWDLDSLFGWQYCGDGESYLEGYPVSSVMGRHDITALTWPGGLQRLRETQWAEMP